MRLSKSAWCLVVSVVTAHGAVPDFAREIRPLFEAHCVKCHGPEKQKSGLRFDIREGAFRNGDSGEKPIVPGHAAQSRLIYLVSSKEADERMPPKGAPLAASQVDLLKRWIDAGAEWPATTSAVVRSELVVTDEDRKHWSFLPLQKPKPPAVKNRNWLRTPVDAFILARLEARQLSPSRMADARILVRRIYFDLIGLPPTPEQVEAFVAASGRDPRQALGALIDQLLAGPHYGERWGRHWLDVARYADSSGQEADFDRPTAHHYRDFVIRAFNDDLSFDTFLRWQLAGDEIEPNNPQAVAATGFIVAGPNTILDVPMEEEKIRNRFNELDDMISTTGSAMLGLTVACARCHDHKYDAIPTRDYYRLQRAFNAGDRAEVPLAPVEEVRRHRHAEAKWKRQLDESREEFDQFRSKLRKAYETAARHAKIEGLKATAEEKRVLKEEPESSEAKVLADKFSKELKLEDKDYRRAATEAERAEWEAREKAVKTIEAQKPKALPAAHAFADFAAQPRETWLLNRGDFKVKQEPVELGFLSVLSRGKSAADYWNAARQQSRREDSTQQRRALADWMTDLDYGAGALAARVIVNRVWQRHFGEGLVRTVNDFGVQGEPPSHPELLEWLASDFVRGGWKLKPLHRLIMTSAVYLQDTTFDETKSRIDPDNRLLWRRRPQRIESEILRDSMLAVSGALNQHMFGPAFKAPIAAEAIQARNVKNPYPKDLEDTVPTHRRTVYMFHKRVIQYPLLQAFDGPDAQASCGRRESTTVAPQALALMNDKFVRARAVDFARRISREEETEAAVRLGWRLAFSREPSSAELEAARNFVDGQMRARADRKAKANPREQALADFCQALFAMNEFIYVD